MRKKLVVLVSCLVLVQVGVVLQVMAEKKNVIELPQAQTDGGKPLMQVLKERKTTRSFSSKKLPNQVLSNLLWAAFGINRPESGKRTAPSAVNWQEVDIYVATEEGLYIYEAKRQELVLVLDKDIRVETGKQGFVKDAPINLVFVADYLRMEDRPEEAKDFYAAVDTGFISQNVYLFCASEGLATVVRGLVDRDKLTKVMKLNENQKVILAHTDCRV